MASKLDSTVAMPVEKVVADTRRSFVCCLCATFSGQILMNDQPVRDIPASGNNHNGRLSPVNYAI